MEESGKNTRGGIRRMAERLGLARLSPGHLEQLERALAAARQRRERLPRDLPPAEEPAHIFRAGGEA